MIKVSGKVDRFAFVSKVKNQTEKTIQFFLDRVAERMRAVMRLNKHGIKYKRLPHRSSAPGEAPREQSHRLEQSISQPVVKGLRGQMKITAPYAERLEYGLDGIAERPYVRASIDVVLSELKKRGTQSQLAGRFNP